MLERTVVVIKPDAVRDVLDQLIINDLIAETGARVIWRKFWTFTTEDCHRIYPEWVERDVFPFMCHNLTMGQSLILIFEGEGSTARIKKAKGKMNGGGLRRKFRTRSIDDMRAMGMDEETIKRKVAENRLHSTDGPDDASVLLSVCVTASELEDLKAIAPELCLTQ